MSCPFIKKFPKEEVIPLAVCVGLYMGRIVAHSRIDMTYMFMVNVQERIDDDVFYTYPRYIGKSILICGRKSSSFPYQCFVSHTGNL